MARKPRIHFAGALYHVISRGNQRQKIFRSSTDRFRYLDFLQRYQNRYNFRLYAYVLMSNHVHLLVEAGQTPISKVMQGLQQSYTLYFNHRYGFVGHLFQGRYKAILCDRDSYLLELVRYIHLNPVRSKIVREPGEYRWSSHRGYLGKRVGEERLVESAWVLSRFARNRSAAVKRYREFVLAGMADGHREDLYATKEQRYLGDDDFVERIAHNIESEAPPTLRLEVGEIERAVCDQFDLSAEILRAKSKERRGSLGRVVVAYLGQELANIRVQEVARRYGRDQVSLSLGLKRLREKLVEDFALRTSLEKLVGSLRKKC